MGRNDYKWTYSNKQVSTRQRKKTVQTHLMILFKIISNLLKSILAIAIIVIPLFVIAQKQGNIWYFGNHTGLNFNGGIPVPLTNGATYNAGGSCPSEGTATLCDSTGSLLFYTNGQQVWNRNHQIMSNGNDLRGNLSSTQTSLIIPQPGSSRYFYIFTVDDFCNDTLKYGFRYSIVDICSNNGLGDIISEKKNIKLLDTVCEKLTALRHANGTDYWVIVHKYYSNAFYSYHLSAAGIIDTVISQIGSRHPNISGNQDTWDAIGQMKASPNGNKIAIVNGNAGAHAIAEYFNFDNSTGIISNWINLQTNLDYTSNHQYYGVSFSPDNSKLYITCWLNNNGVYQFDLNAGNGNSDSIIASKTKISDQFWHWALQLGPDGKIYVLGTGSYMGVINFPNNVGANCNFQDSAIYFNSYLVGMGLPNYVDSYDYSNTTRVCNDGIEEKVKNSELIFYPNPSTCYLTIETIQKSEIEISNMEGQIIKKFKITENKKIIDISDFSSGIYIIRAWTNDGIMTKKFIKE